MDMMSNIAGVDPSELVTAIYQFRIATYLDIAGAAILAFDFFLTFHLEVEYIWRNPFSMISVLFFVTRYLPFFDTTATLIHDLGHHLSPGLCSILMSAEVWCYVVGYILAVGILTIRTFAIWNRSRTILVSLLVLLAACTLSAAIFTERFLSSFQVAPNPFPVTIRPGCFITNGNNLAFVSYAILLGYETTIFLLTIVKAAHSRIGSDPPSNLCKVVYQDGISFYIYLLVTSIANITLLTGFSSKAFSLGGTHLHRTLHAVLAERIVLNIRRALAPPSHHSTVPDIAFAPRNGSGSANQLSTQNASCSRYVSRMANSGLD